MMKSIRMQPNSAVTLSLLDRLTDIDPKSPTAEAPPTRAESVRILRSGVRRDLEWLLTPRRHPDAAAPTRAKAVPILRPGVGGDLEGLLNTRRNPDDPGAALVETENSLYN